MIVWRLARLAHAKLDGEGARLAGGRWNSRGRAAVYASSRLSLAALELLVHTDVPLVPPDLVAFEIAIPDTLDIETVELAELPKDWRLPGHPGCRGIGDTWLAEERTAVLRVPSAVVPEEWNYIINPAHRAAKAIEVVRRRKFAFDSRLLGQRGGAGGRSARGRRVVRARRDPIPSSPRTRPASAHAPPAL